MYSIEILSQLNNTILKSNQVFVPIAWPFYKLFNVYRDSLVSLRYLNFKVTTERIDHLCCFTAAAFLRGAKKKEK